MSNDEMAAVREFRATLDEPREGALVRGRWQLAGAATPERTRPRRTWLLATGGAAVAVAVVVAAAAAVPSTPPKQEQATPGQQAPTQSPPTVDLPVTQGTKAPMRPPVTGKAGGDHAAAVAALTRIAGQQSGGPLAIGADQVLYVKTYNLIDGAEGSIHELWQDTATGVALRVRRSDVVPRSIDHSLTEAEIAEAAARASQPPGLDNMNGAYVAAFPVGTGSAHQLSASWRAWAAEAYPGREPDSMIFKQLHEVFHYIEPLLGAQQRAALYQALADLSAVKATTASIGGKQYDVLCMARVPQFVDCVLVDSATGRFAGDAYTGSDMRVKADNFDFVDFATQPRPLPGVERPATEEKKGVSGLPTTPKR